MWLINYTGVVMNVKLYRAILMTTLYSQKKKNNKIKIKIKCVTMRSKYSTKKMLSKFW